MAKILNTFAAVERYELVRAGGGVDPEVSAEAVRHACRMPEEPWTGIYAKIADATQPIIAEKSHGLFAACGTWVRVYLPQPFDSEDSRACPQCVDAVGVKG
ncbi:hypothetical protein [Mycolicibacterium vinylchloridicum]|uniref:hypothetical protein n=1 Tax=Mycolicibacterium vinylchloridicum TaxID=2736928 RepID=UPI0015CC9CD5|nr:hypothetical protein [Mycolicibacterium vinylchloridicum]